MNGGEAEVGLRGRGVEVSVEGGRSGEKQSIPRHSRLVEECGGGGVDLGPGDVDGCLAQLGESRWEGGGGVGRSDESDVVVGRERGWEGGWRRSGEGRSERLGVDVLVGRGGG